MSEPFTDAEREAGARLLARLQAPERIAAVLADLDQVPPPDAATAAFHPRDCWTYHAGCLAARIRCTLTEEDPNAAA